jgi:hypothetical protein
VDVLLLESASCTLDANGNGSVSLGPINQFQEWNVTNEACTVTSNVSEPTFKYYLANGLSAGALIGGSNEGSSDSDNTPILLLPTMKLTGVWANGDPGATATFVLHGTMTVPG